MEGGKEYNDKRGMGLDCLTTLTWRLKNIGAIDPYQCSTGLTIFYEIFHHSNWMWKCYVEHCQAHIRLLWIWIMLCLFIFSKSYLLRASCFGNEPWNWHVSDVNWPSGIYWIMRAKGIGKYGSWFFVFQSHLEGLGVCLWWCYARMHKYCEVVIIYRNRNIMAISWELRATPHTRLRARNQYTSSTLIGGKGEGAGPSSLLRTTLEGPTEYVNARWM